MIRFKIVSNFKITNTDKQARTGILKTAHGEVQTPIFMPVGTQGSVKALSPEDLLKTHAQIILGNTYHLYLRPGSKLIKKLGGLNHFMGWEGPILTDSGGFQAFSLGAMIEHGVRKTPPGQTRTGSVPSVSQVRPLRHWRMRSTPEISPSGHPFPTPLLSKITEDGIEFTSHLDGSKHLLTPEKSIEVQLDLGSDICLVLDELLSPLHSPDYVKKSLARTHLWEERSKDYFKKHVKKSLNPTAQLFGILQGVYDQKIREEEAKWVAKQDFSGISIGGSFGISDYWHGSETPSRCAAGATPPGRWIEWAAAKAIYETVDWVVPHLPEAWPKHILGIGEVQDIFKCVERGADMFDCVSATRRARNGSLYLYPQNGGKVTAKFTLLISKSEFKDDSKPINPGCGCYTCQNFSRAYLRHLFLAQELLYFRLASFHNVYFLNELMAKIRQAIADKQFAKLKRQWLG